MTPENILVNLITLNIVDQHSLGNINKIKLFFSQELISLNVKKKKKFNQSSDDKKGIKNQNEQNYKCN